MDATQITSAAPESDPTLSSLVPRRSTRRNLLLASAVLLLFVGGWTSPHMLRPSVNSGRTFGSNTALARHHQVLTTVELTPDGWPNVGLQSMGDLPGARVAGAWAFPGALIPSQVGTDPADFTTGLDYLRASFPHNNFGQASRLPQHLDPGESAQLYILWDITDCSLLTQDPQPQIELTSILGTRTHEQLPTWVGPISALSTQPGNSACPTP
jgi:hypothetical protein